MILNKLLWPVLVVFWCGTVYSAPVTWTFKNTSFTDTKDFGVVEGSFDYESKTDTYSNINIRTGATVNGANKTKFTAVTYTNYIPSSDPGTVNFTTAAVGESPVGQRVLQLVFGRGGTETYAFLLEALCKTANPDCSTYDTLTAGYRTSFDGKLTSNYVPAPKPVPEPTPTPIQKPQPIPTLSQWSLLILFFLMVGLSRRKLFR
jgi:hypothetical protein